MILTEMNLYTIDIISFQYSNMVLVSITQSHYIEYRAYLMNQVKAIYFVSVWKSLKSAWEFSCEWKYGGYHFPYNFPLWQNAESSNDDEVLMHLFIAGKQLWNILLIISLCVYFKYKIHR